MAWRSHRYASERFGLWTIHGEWCHIYNYVAPLAETLLSIRGGFMVAVERGAGRRGREADLVFRALRFGMLACLFILFGGCNQSTVDLSAVQDYVKATATAGTAFGALADDLYHSCLRYQEYALTTNAGGAPLWSDVLAPTTPPSGASRRANLSMGDAHCQESSDLAHTWTLENDVLLSYVHALGAIAGVDTVPTNFGTLGASLKNAGVIAGDPVATAAATLAEKIAGSLIAARQRRSIQEIAATARTAGLNKLVRDLQRVTTLGYLRKLDNERLEVDGYYATIIQLEVRELNAFECATTVQKEAGLPLGCTRYRHVKNRTLMQGVIAEGKAAQLRDLIRRQRLARDKTFQMIARHENAANAYNSAIGDIAAGNDAILAQPGALKGVAAAIRPYAADLQGSTTALLNALKK